jgi:hypothetical protein
MEIKIKGHIVEKGDNGDTYYFTIKTESDVYKAKNCKIVPTTPEYMTKGCICYSGNIEFKKEGLLQLIAVVLWVFPDLDCVLVYKE